MAWRDLTGAIDFDYLEAFAAGDQAVVDEVLELFGEQAEMWSKLLHADQPNWRDAAHTVKGSARGVGAVALADACEAAERGTGTLDEARFQLELALADIAAYRHERLLQSLKGADKFSPS